jgi:hypothetical protein
MAPSAARILIALGTCIAIHIEAQPAITYSTFGPGDRYNISAGWLVNGSANPPQPYVAEAFAFTPSTSGFLTQIRLAIGANAGNTANDLVNIFIAASGSQNLPGLTLDRFVNVPCTNMFGVDNPLLSLTSTNQPFLQSGTTYWLWVQAALPQTSLVVNENDQGIMASAAQSFSPGSWSAKGSRTTFAFDVTVVPEPCSGAIAAIGVGLLTLRNSCRPR